MTAIRIILNLIGIAGHLAFWFTFFVMFSMGCK
jgi:hypothetical protein